MVAARSAYGKIRYTSMYIRKLSRKKEDGKSFRKVSRICGQSIKHAFKKIGCQNMERTHLA